MVAAATKVLLRVGLGTAAPLIRPGVEELLEMTPLSAHPAHELQGGCRSFRVLPAVGTQVWGHSQPGPSTAPGAVCGETWLFSSLLASFSSP